jgi:hypothetical protein
MRHGWGRFGPPQEDDEENDWLFALLVLALTAVFLGLVVEMVFRGVLTGELIWLSPAFKGQAPSPP